MNDTVIGAEDMHHCDVKPQLDNFVKLNHCLSAGFAVVVVGVGALFAVIDLKLSPVIENVKRNEQRNIVVESELITANKNTGDQLMLMVKGIDRMNNNFSNLKYIYATKSELRSKIDINEIDKRLLKTEYRVKN